MLVTFSTKSYSNIMMFDDIAKRMLTMMGHSQTIPGAILADEVPEALNQLRNSLNLAEGQRADAPADEDESEHIVSLRHRAFPLIELLENAQKKHNDVMWK